MQKTMWAVGPDDGEGWKAINAPDYEAARRAFAATEEDWQVDEDGTASLGIVATRVESWDALDGPPRGRDWIRAGLGYTCSGCGEMAYEPEGAEVIDGLAYCEGCAEAIVEEGTHL